MTRAPPNMRKRTVEMGDMMVAMTALGEMVPTNKKSDPATAEKITTMATQVPKFSKAAWNPHIQYLSRISAFLSAYLQLGCLRDSHKERWHYELRRKIDLDG